MNTAEQDAALDKSKLPPKIGRIMGATTLNIIRSPAHP